MGTVICPQVKNCGVKMVVEKDSKGKAVKETLGCPHMVNHEHMDGCNNGICMLVVPKSSKCIPVEVSVVEQPPVVLPDTDEPTLVEKLEESLAAAPLVAVPDSVPTVEQIAPIEEKVAAEKLPE
jgi:hypothetical protein